MSDTVVTPWEATAVDGGYRVTRMVIGVGRYEEQQFYKARGRQGPPMEHGEAVMRAAALNVGQAAADAVVVPTGTTTAVEAALRRQAAETARLDLVNVRQATPAVDEGITMDSMIREHGGLSEAVKAMKRR